MDLISNIYIKGHIMKYSIIFLTLFSGLVLSACDRPVVDNTADTVVVPVPTPGPAGEAGVAGEQGVPGVQGEPGNPSGDTVIITPPPEVNMPPEVVPPVEPVPSTEMPPAQTPPAN